MQLGGPVPGNNAYCDDCYKEYLPEVIANFARMGSTHLKRLWENRQIPAMVEKLREKEGKARGSEALHARPGKKQILESLN